MRCNYDELEVCSHNLDDRFNNIKLLLDDIKDSYSKVLSLSNWDSETRDYFYKKNEIINNNYDILCDKFDNVIEYLELVANNYKLEDDYNNFNDAFDFADKIL